MKKFRFYKSIEFQIRDWENGFFVTFRIPYSIKNYEAVIRLPGSAEIKLLTYK